MTSEAKQAMAAVHFVQELAIGAYQPHEIESRSKEIARMAPMAVQDEADPVLSTETGRVFSIDLKNAHTLADFVNNAGPECSPIDALHKCIDRLAEYARPEVGMPTSPQEPAFWIVRGRRGKRTWVLHPADSEVNARAVANGLKDATITPMYTCPQPAPLPISLAGTLLVNPLTPPPAKPSPKTGRDLYQAYKSEYDQNSDGAPLQSWCELSDEDQNDWHAKAKEQEGGWIERKGGSQPPIPSDTCVLIRYRGLPEVSTKKPQWLAWTHSQDGTDPFGIIAYRIAKEQA